MRNRTGRPCVKSLPTSPCNRRHGAQGTSAASTPLPAADLGDLRPPPLPRQKVSVMCRDSGPMELQKPNPSCWLAAQEDYECRWMAES